MSAMLQVLILGAVIYGMKAVPFVWRIVPQSPRVEPVLDVLPIGLLSALLLPPVLLGAVDETALGGIMVLAAVVAAFAVSLMTRRSIWGIAAGLAVLGLAQFV